MVLAIDNSDDPGIADVFFEDSEGSGAAYGCADALGTPTLTLNESNPYGIYLPLVMKQQ